MWSEIESLYRSRFTQFVRVARAVTGDRDSALEAVQDGFADALRNAGQWKGEGPLEGWVWRCVINRARKARRRAAVEIWGGDGRNNDDDEGDGDSYVSASPAPAGPSPCDLHTDVDEDGEASASVSPSPSPHATGDAEAVAASSIASSKASGCRGDLPSPWACRRGPGASEAASSPPEGSSMSARDRSSQPRIRKVAAI